MKKNLLLTLLALLMLCAFSLAVPLGSLTDEARASYMNAPVDDDDEYAFLFD